MVLVHHGFYLLTPNTKLAAVASVGFVGVGFFFVLSGFVLTWSHNPDLPVRYFYGRRLARIYPLHLVTAVLALGLALALGQGVEPGQALLNLLLLQSWVPVESFGSSLNGVSWSLCCEAFFYLMFPALGRWARRWDLSAAIWVVAGVLVMVAVTAVILLPHDAAQQFLYKGPAYRTGGFILGIILALQIKGGRRLKVSVKFAVVFACFSYCLALAASLVATRVGLPDLRVYGDLITLPAAYVLIAAATRSDLNGEAGLLRHPRLVVLGEASFALYMTHYLLLTAWVGFVGVPGSMAVGVAVFVGLSLVSVVISVAAYRWIEHPAERYFRARIGTPPATAHRDRVAAAER